MKQRLCPYTTNLLSETKLVNNEHILPVAIGAPTSFHVLADAAMNSRMNELIDAPFSNDPLVRFFAMSQGVQSRSGPVTVELQGTVKGTNEEVRTVFAKTSIDMRYAKPVEIDPESGLVKVVKGFNGNAAKIADVIKKNYAKKGIVANIGPRIVSEGSRVQGDLSCDLNVVRKELVKIAYLASVRIWGDRAIDSASGEMYRRAINSTDIHALGEIGFKGAPENMLAELLGETQHHEHLLLSFVQDDDLVSIVSLFGVFEATFITPADELGAHDSDGECIRVNASTSQMQIRSYLDELICISQLRSALT